MYPTLSDFINELFGTHLNLPIQSFGLMMAISFLFAAWTLSIELKRKERNGLIQAVTIQFTKGQPASVTDILTSALIGFIICFKLVYILFNYSEFAEDTQGVILSGKGNWLAGIIGAAVMGYYKYREGQKNKLPQPEEVTQRVPPSELVGNFTIAAAVGGLLGAKIFHNLENWDDFVHDPIHALLSFSGLTFYGGLICGALAVLWYARKIKIPALVMCDATAPGLMLAYGVGRLGCQISGDGDWGIENLVPKPGWMSFLPDWFWAYRYPHNVNSVGIPIPGCEGKHCMMLENAVFPTPLYEAIICILLFFVLWKLRFKIKETGVLFAIYIILNGIERFFIEKIRVNERYHLFGKSFTQAELISSLLIISGVILLIFLRKNKNNLPDATSRSMS